MSVGVISECGCFQSAQDSFRICLPSILDCGLRELPRVLQVP